MGEDALLPKTLPRRLGLIVTVGIVVVIIAMVVGAILGNVQWLIGVGGAGTAVGTLTLAYFTFTVAKRTTEELRATVTQATAATATALEAQRTRIDALAPFVDVEINWQRTRVRPRPSPVGTAWTYLEPGKRYDANINDIDVIAELELVFKNYGRTPAFMDVKYVGAWFEGSDQRWRVSPTPQNRLPMRVELQYVGPTESPFDAREISYQFEVQGLLEDTADRIVWVGEITMLRWTGRDWAMNEKPLAVKQYKVTREHKVSELATVS